MEEDDGDLDDEEANLSVHDGGDDSSDAGSVDGADNKHGRRASDGDEDAMQLDSSLGNHTGKQDSNMEEDGESAATGETEKSELMKNKSLNKDDNNDMAIQGLLGFASSRLNKLK